MRNFFSRIFYNYFLRDFSIASIELFVGTLFILFGTIFGAVAWYHAITTRVPAPVGTIMLSVLTIILGIQFIISFINYDISNIPNSCLSNKMKKNKNSA